jgi:hypothetical protein
VKSAAESDFTRRKSKQDIASDRKNHDENVSKPQFVSADNHLPNEKPMNKKTDDVKEIVEAIAVETMVTENGLTESTSEVQIEKFFTIPSNLVGLLLARRPPNLKMLKGRNARPSIATIINQIQSYTRTVIVRLSVPTKSDKMDANEEKDHANSEVKPSQTAEESSQPLNGKQSNVIRNSNANRRRRAQENEDDDEDSDDGDEDEEDGENGDDGNEPSDVDNEEDSGADEDALSGSKSLDENDINKKETSKESSAPIEDVPFRISGKIEKSVDDAIACINEIVGGKRIRDAMLELKEK